VKSNGAPVPILQIGSTRATCAPSARPRPTLTDLLCTAISREAANLRADVEQMDIELGDLVQQEDELVMRASGRLTTQCPVATPASDRQWSRIMDAVL
jgi:hypothetical protein